MSDFIAPGIKMKRLNAVEHPGTVRALNVVREDNGGPAWPKENDPLIPEYWVPYLWIIEPFLASLSETQPAPEDADAVAQLAGGSCLSRYDSELWAFCAGEEDTMLAMTQRGAEAKMANLFLNDFFDGWRGLKP